MSNNVCILYQKCATIRLKTLEFRLFGLPFAYIDINISLRQIEYRKHDYIYREIEALER